jgi:hypothetical protein
MFRSRLGDVGRIFRPAVSGAPESSRRLTMMQPVIVFETPAA